MTPRSATSPPSFVVLCGVGAALLALHRLGGNVVGAPPLTSPIEMIDWINEQGALPAAFGLLRIATLCLGWYLVFVYGLMQTARLAHHESWNRVVDAVTLPTVRRAFVGAAGLSVSSALVFGGAPKAHAEPTPTSSDRMVELPLAPEPTSAPTSAPSTTLPSVPAPVGRAATREADEWTVEPGDSLWSIARDALSDSLDRTVSDREVAPYWIELIELNRDRLVVRDNPHLIFPGQSIALPPINPG